MHNNKYILLMKQLTATIFFSATSNIGREFQGRVQVREENILRPMLFAQARNS